MNHLTIVIMFTSSRGQPRGESSLLIPSQCGQTSIRIRTVMQSMDCNESLQAIDAARGGGRSDSLLVERVSEGLLYEAKYVRRASILGVGTADTGEYYSQREVRLITTHQIYRQSHMDIHYDPSPCSRHRRYGRVLLAARGTGRR